MKDIAVSDNAGILSYIQALNINKVNKIVSNIAKPFSRFSIEGKIGILGIMCILLMAVFAPVITIYPPQKITGDSLEPPDSGNILGTDELGMDI
jgi:peptide/nickel transport system permease protein